MYRLGVRTNIDLDDDLLRPAAEIAGTKTTKSTVEFASRNLIERRSMADFLDMTFDVDPDAVRPDLERVTELESET